MEDKLKSFIKDNREDFDVFEPRPDLWQDINNKLPAKAEAKEAKVVSFRKTDLLKYAAGLAIILVSVFMLGRYQQQNNESATATVPLSKQQSAFETIVPELAQVEAHYTTVIEQKQQELNEFDLKALGLDNELDKEMRHLDSTYNLLKQELYESPNKEKVIDAMTLNMQHRIELLNKQLNTLKKISRLQINDRDENITI